MKCRMALAAGHGGHDRQAGGVPRPLRLIEVRVELGLAVNATDSARFEVEALDGDLHR